VDQPCADSQRQALTKLNKGLDPQAPGLFRDAMEDTQIVEGQGKPPVTVHKGQRIFVSLYHANRDVRCVPYTIFTSLCCVIPSLFCLALIRKRWTLHGLAQTIRPLEAECTRMYFPLDPRLILIQPACNRCLGNHFTEAVSFVDIHRKYDF
jgi:hypothetical protein